MDDRSLNESERMVIQTIALWNRLEIGHFNHSLSNDKGY